MKDIFITFISTLTFLGCSSGSSSSNRGSTKDPARSGDESNVSCLKTQTPFDRKCWHSLDVDDHGIRLRQLDTEEVRWLYKVGESNIGKFFFDLKAPGENVFRRGTVVFCNWPMNFPTEAEVLEAHCEKKIDTNGQYCA
jgi:hypothetical protein